jgi:hypothetical protein
MLCLAETPQELLACMSNHQHPVDAVKRWMRE